MGIPEYIKKKLRELPRMKTCALSGKGYGFCDGHIEWHHAWHYAGGQINEVWAIVGACVKHHEMEKGNPAIDHAFKCYSLKHATESDLNKYEKKDWKLEKHRCQ